jgi:peptide subunit release factor 1 (eRF1)
VVTPCFEQLAPETGAGTELVSVTVPAGDSLAATRRRVASEHAAAENSRSKRSRTNVRRAPGRIQRLLRAYERTPDCGLAFYAEVVDGDYLDHRLRDRLLGTYGVEYATDQGVDAVEGELLDAEQRAVHETIEVFFAGLRGENPVVYGVEAILQAAEYGAVAPRSSRDGRPGHPREGRTGRRRPGRRHPGGPGRLRARRASARRSASARSWTFR